MPLSSLILPENPIQALESILGVSHQSTVMVFKKSPTCPISLEAEAEWRRFLRTEPDRISVAEIDVIAQRALARGLVAELGIRHESPQVLLFVRGALQWHESHGEITENSLREHWAAATRVLGLGG